MELTIDEYLALQRHQENKVHMAHREGYTANQAELEAADHRANTYYSLAWAQCTEAYQQTAAAMEARNLELKLELDHLKPLEQLVATLRAQAEIDTREIARLKGEAARCSREPWPVLDHDSMVAAVLKHAAHYFETSGAFEVEARRVLDWRGVIMVRIAASAIHPFPPGKEEQYAQKVSQGILDRAAKHPDIPESYGEPMVFEESVADGPVKS